MTFSSSSPVVSIIILCYNQAHLISRAIESVLNQTYKNIQIVVVDDCSKDNSKEVIEHWKEKFPDKLKIHFQESNVGHPANMNAGYRLCDGELVTHCDGDDWYFPEKVEQEVNFLKRHPDVDIVHSNFDFYSISGEFRKHWATEEKEIPVGDIFLPLFSLKYPMNVHFHYEMTSKKIISETGYYDEQIPIWVDWDFRLRLAANHKVGYCHKVLSAYSHNPEGLTHMLNQEIILKYLQYVINKNKHFLKKYPEELGQKAFKAINLPIEKLGLAINMRKGNPSVFKTLQFLWNYPAEITDFKFILNSMFGKRFMQALSGIKRKFKKPQPE